VNIGLLEDDPHQTELIRVWLEEGDYSLVSFASGGEFKAGFNQHRFDLLLFDWQLPDISGLDMLDWLRLELKSNLPVLFITSRDNETSIVTALDHGADDYLVKPVSKPVTLARINALARRNRIATPSTEPESFAPYSINDATQSISIHDETPRLTHKEYELAAFLFRHAGNLVSRDYLLEEIWGTRGDLNTRTVDTHISRIRSKLGINPTNGWQLASIYQRGYRLSRTEPR
jgi:DNA-binding response OmpR family regulator